jgi:3-methyladenine DNA glycosylase AlkD
VAGFSERLREALSAAADPARAPGMQAYMKSAMPYLGVPTPARRAVFRAVFGKAEWRDAAAWQTDALTLWREAKFREERNCAIELGGLRAARAFQTMGALPLYEEMIVTGAWWDHVDAIAGQRLLTLLRAEPGPMKQAMREWAHGEDMWKRRSSILCQLNAGAATDLDFLYACIAPSLGSKEFFLRKAIGWALRQYARTDPAEVARYVAEHDTELSPLSKREALKRIAA